MATEASSSAANSESNFESFDLDLVSSLLECGLFYCDDEMDETAKRLDAEITDELNSTEKEVCKQTFFD